MHAYVYVYAYAYVYVYAYAYAAFRFKLPGQSIHVPHYVSDNMAEYLSCCGKLKVKHGVTCKYCRPTYIILTGACEKKRRPRRIAIYRDIRFKPQIQVGTRTGMGGIVDLLQVAFAHLGAAGAIFGHLRPCHRCFRVSSFSAGLHT